MAWSSSEYYLALILARLMSVPDLSTFENIERAAQGKAVMMLDTNAVFAIYFAVESSRGRRRVVFDLAKAKLDEKTLTKASYDDIKLLLDDHERISKVRNKYAHTAMGWSEKGHYVLLDRKMMLTADGGTKRERDPRVRASDNKVDANMVKDVGDRLEKWIASARRTLTDIATKPPTAKPRTSNI
ncbi:hypothetical protein [Ancylobacter moscoviensis]